MKKVLLWLLEQTAAEVAGKTGTKAPCSGVWRSGNEFIPLSKNETFPPSKNDWWFLVINLS